MTKLFGLGDILAGLLLVASFYQLDLPRSMTMALGAYLIIKGLIFIMNLFSLLDIGAGVLLVFGLTAVVPWPVLIGLAVFLGLKGLFSSLS